MKSGLLMGIKYLLSMKDIPGSSYKKLIMVESRYAFKEGLKS